MVLVRVFHIVLVWVLVFRMSRIQTLVDTPGKKILNRCRWHELPGISPVGSVTAAAFFLGREA